MAKAKSSKSSQPVAASVSNNGSVRIRQIANGYIVETAKQTRQGYAQTEKFYPKKPVVKIS